jgi:hypothetical protein
MIVYGSMDRQTLDAAYNNSAAVADSDRYALIQTWSGNEPWTREKADLSFARAMAVADTARRNRCVPILVTLLRCSGPTSKPRRTGNITALGLVPRVSGDSARFPRNLL